MRAASVKTPEENVNVIPKAHFNLRHILTFIIGRIYLSSSKHKIRVRKRNALNIVILI